MSEEMKSKKRRIDRFTENAYMYLLRKMTGQVK